jgi:hypothetical protein
MIIKEIADKVYKKASLMLEIIKLVISTRPATFIIILCFSIVQGVLPLGFAWAMKSIMDLITLNFNKGASILSSELIMVIVLYIFLIIANPLIFPIHPLSTISFVLR